MSFNDALDSYYVYTRNRIHTMNPSRVVKGVSNAQDWPPKDYLTDAFYLLVIGEVPIGRQGYSMYSPIVFHQVQWVWLNRGTDLPAKVRQTNRGDRYRTVQAMKGELIYATVPGYTTKYQWTVDVNGNFVQMPEPITTEFITWTPISFHEKVDRESGMVYGSASLRIVDMTDVVTS